MNHLAPTRRLFALATAAVLTVAACSDDAEPTDTAVDIAPTNSVTGSLPADPMPTDSVGG